MGALEALVADCEQLRRDALHHREERRKVLRAGDVDYLSGTEHIRTKAWKVSPAPATLMERRVELMGGASRSELVNGMNAGAKSYIADLWNFTPGDRWNVMRAHRNLQRAAQLDLAYLPSDGGRIRINPNTTTRLQVVPRPLHVLERAVILDDEPVPACFFDMASLVAGCGRGLMKHQEGIFLYLRDVQGHLEARLWATMFRLLEKMAGLAEGSIKATVMVDSVAGALEADEILFELSQHAAGLSLDPQGYAADHIALFSGPDRTVLPDRESIGLNAPFLRNLSLHLVGIAHRRGCHAIGAPSMVLPPLDPDRVKAIYLEMLSDMEREAVDGHDGTIVVDAGTVNAAMREFNKSMPMAHQIYLERNDHITPADLIGRPEGTLSVDSLLGCVRTALRTVVQRKEGQGWVIQGGRVHDRSSLRLALRLLWQWCHSTHGVISDSGLEVNPDLLRYLVRKECTKMYGQADPPIQKVAERAAEQLLEQVMQDDLPLEPVE